jgi:hypothetical protein
MDERLARQAAFIEAKLERSSFERYALRIDGTDEEVVSGMGDALRNLVRSFFGGVGSVWSSRVCEFCSTTTGRFERAHHRDAPREEAALAAVRQVRAEVPVGPFPASLFMRRFLEQHRSHVLWNLCAACHLKYDRAAIKLPLDAVP